MLVLDFMSERQKLVRNWVPIHVLCVLPSINNCYDAIIILAGKIPLRQLVYRVLDLPPSMRPLVYDFGQLQQGTEDDYIKQIVHDHVRYFCDSTMSCSKPLANLVLHFR